VVKTINSPNKFSELIQHRKQQRKDQPSQLTERRKRELKVKEFESDQQNSRCSGGQKRSK
jgi:hypothetical protein